MALQRGGHSADEGTVTAADLTVRLLPTDPRDMVPSAVAWAQAVEQDVDTVPATEIVPAYRDTLTLVIWTLAGAADFEDRIPKNHTAAMLAAEAGAGARTWQKRTAWLRARGWLEHGPGGRQSDGWQLRLRDSETGTPDG